MTKTLNDIKTTIPLKESIDDILASASLKVGVKNVCDKYTKLLESGNRSEELAQSFLNEMEKFSSLSSVNTTLTSLQRSIDNKNTKNNNAMICEMQSMRRNDPQTFALVEGYVVDYMASKTNESANALKNALSIFRGRKEVESILECMQVDVYAKTLGQNVQTVELYESAEPETVYTKEQVDEMINNAVSESRAAAEANKVNESKKSIYSLEDKTGLVESINRILAKESRNANVKAICEQFKALLREGKSPASLCESFISTMGPFGFLNAVDTELSAIGGKIAKYKQEIDLVKIVEAMKQTTSYYIVPIIESAVVDYVNNKCMPTRVVLCQVCENFKSDPFVKDILYIVNSDQSIDNLFLGRTLEVSESVKTSQTFSPAQYINENCFVFNAFGNYYQKKNGSVLKLHKDEIAKLDESFKHVCDCINSNGVSYNFADDSIEVKAATTNHIAKIYESGRVDIDGAEVNISEIKTPQFLGLAQYEGSYEFYDKVIALSECATLFTVDFAKRVSLNESNKSVDVFRLGDRISISLNEGAESQFRSNINPIKFKKYVNEHMQLKVDEAFADIMPNQKLLESSINDAKDAYESYLKTLQDSKQELLQMKESGETEDAAEIDNMIGALDKEIEDITNNYKEVQKDADELTATSDKDDDTEDDDDKEPGDEEASGDLKDQVSDPITTDSGDSVSDTDAATQGETLDGPVPVTDHDFDPYEDFTKDEVSEFDPVLDTPAHIESGSEDAIKVQDVSFERNVKTNKVTNHGTVTILIPTVNSNGDVRNEIKSVSFTLDANRNPIINNDYMPLYMYNTILSAIKESPELDKVDVSAGAAGFDSTDIPTTSTTGVESGDENLGIGEPTNATVTSVATVSEVPDFGDDEVLSTPETTPANDATTPITGLDNDANDVNLDTKKDDLSFDDESIDDPIFKGDKAFEKIGQYPFDFIIAEDDIVLAKDPSVSKLGAFEKYLSNNNIAFTHTTQKDESGSEVKCVKVKIGGKDDASMLKDVIVRGLGYTEDLFFKAYPEMRACESLNLPKASKIYEAFDEGAITVDFPHDDGLFDTLGDAGFDVEKRDSDTVTLNVPGQYQQLLDIVERWVNETDDLPKSYVDEIREKIDRYRIDGGVVTAKPSSGLEHNLDKAGIEYTEDNGELNIPVRTYESAKTLENLSSRYQFLGESAEELKHIVNLNEGILITIEDTETHKKITVDTDDLEKEGKTDDEKDNEEDNKDNNTSFGDDTELFNSKDDAESAKSGDNGQGGEQQSESVTEKPAAKKKFKFTSKKTNESVAVFPEITSGSKVVYTDAKGKKFDADVTGVRDGGKLILVVQGHTVVADRSKVKLSPLADKVDPALSNIDLVGMKTK